MTTKRTTADLERMGEDIAHTCEWNGLEILRVAIAALTDANFHDESKILEQMLSAIESGKNDTKYDLVISEELE